VFMNDNFYSQPFNVLSVGDHLVFSDFTITLGQELWHYSPSIPESPHQNKVNRLDVNNDSEVRPQDILLMVDEMRRNGVRGLEGGVAPDWFVDVNGDNRFTPQDILLLVDYLNRRARYQYFPSSNDDAMGELLASGEAAADQGTLVADTMYHDIAVGIASSQAMLHEETLASGRSRFRLASVR
jgi:hypothetical protein